MRATARVISFMGPKHLRAATRALNEAWGECRKSDDASAGEPDSELVKALTSSSIISSSAYLEAAINRVYADAGGGSESLEGLSDDSIENLADVWRRSEGLRPRKFRRVIEEKNPPKADRSTLRKCQVALFLAGKDPFDRGAPPYQPAYAFLTLRNELVHYAPEEVEKYSDAGEETKRHVEAVIDCYVDKDPQLEGTSSFVNEYLWPETAAWGLNCILSFSKAFYDRMGIQDPVEDEKEALNGRGSTNST